MLASDRRNSSERTGHGLAGDVAAIAETFLVPRDLDYSTMDCEETNIAVLLRLLGAPVQGALGSQWHFAFEARDDAHGVVLEREPRPEQLEALGGVRADTHLIADAIEESLPELLATYGALVVFCDSFELPWSPLYQRQHLEHTVAVLKLDAETNSALAIDTYANLTEHGPAVPTITIIEWSALKAAVKSLSGGSAGQAIGLQRIVDVDDDGASALRFIAANANAIATSYDDGAYQRFAESYEEALGRGERAEDFTLASWLVARKRGLHALWLRHANAASDGAALPEEFVERFEREVVAPWRRVMTFAYVVGQRLRSGRSGAVNVTQLVAPCAAAEATLARELIAWRPLAAYLP